MGGWGLEGALERGELGGEERGVEGVGEGGVGEGFDGWGVEVGEEVVVMGGRCIFGWIGLCG